LIPIKNLFSRDGIELWAKVEWKQISGSVKARAAYHIIRNAVENGALHENMKLLDATSGNTGIAYAAIGKKIGLKVTLCVPENVTQERKDILVSLGAEIIYTSKFEGTDGAQIMAREMASSFPEKYFYADQYRNENNWKAHYHTTAEEIFLELPAITHFVAGVGTSGTFVGTARRLKEFDENIRSIALHPDSALHGLEGWKHMETAIVPSIYDSSLANENISVSTEEAYEMVRMAWEKEKLYLSPSSAANLAGAMKVISQIEKGMIVTVLPDDGSKYKNLLQKLIPDA
ncbi:MAG: PLP-dependent cysteine synthase family protein, partial [Flavisolibacter sp.]